MKAQNESHHNHESSQVLPLCLDRRDVGRAWSLLAVDHLILDLLVLLQLLEAVSLDGAEVDEDVLGAIIGRDEAEPFGLVEPFDGSVGFA